MNIILTYCPLIFLTSFLTPFKKGDETLARACAHCNFYFYFFPHFLIL